MSSRSKHEYDSARIRVRVLTTSDSPLLQNVNINPFMTLIHYSESPTIGDVENKILKSIDLELSAKNFSAQNADKEDETGVSVALAYKGGSLSQAGTESSINPFKTPTLSPLKSNASGSPGSAGRLQTGISNVNHNQKSGKNMDHDQLSVLDVHQVQHDSGQSGSSNNLDWKRSIKFSTCEIWMDDFLLLSTEKSEILRDNDVLTAKVALSLCSSQNPSIPDETEETVLVAKKHKNKKKKRKRQTSDCGSDLDQSKNEEESSDPKKKRLSLSFGAEDETTKSSVKKHSVSLEAEAKISESCNKKLSVSLGTEEKLTEGCDISNFEVKRKGKGKKKKSRKNSDADITVVSPCTNEKGSEVEPVETPNKGHQASLNCPSSEHVKTVDDSKKVSKESEDLNGDANSTLSPTDQNVKGNSNEGGSCHNNQTMEVINLYKGEAEGGTSNVGEKDDLSRGKKDFSQLKYRNRRGHVKGKCGGCGENKELFCPNTGAVRELPADAELSSTKNGEKEELNVIDLVNQRVKEIEEEEKRVKRENKLSRSSLAALLEREKKLVEKKLASVVSQKLSDMDNVEPANSNADKNLSPGNSLDSDKFKRKRNRKRRNKKKGKQIEQTNTGAKFEQSLKCDFIIRLPEAQMPKNTRVTFGWNSDEELSVVSLNEMEDSSINTDAVNNNKTCSSPISGPTGTGSDQTDITTEQEKSVTSTNATAGLEKQQTACDSEFVPTESSTPTPSPRFQNGNSISPEPKNKSVLSLKPKRKSRIVAAIGSPSVHSVSQSPSPGGLEQDEIKRKSLKMATSTTPKSSLVHTNENVIGTPVDPNNQFQSLLNKRRYTGRQFEVVQKEDGHTQLLCSRNKRHVSGSDDQYKNAVNPSKDVLTNVSTVYTCVSKGKDPNPSGDTSQLNGNKAPINESHQINQNMLPSLPSPSVLLRDRDTVPRSLPVAVREMYYDYNRCEKIEDLPLPSDVIAYKVLELSENYTPVISNFKEATVMAIDVKERSLLLQPKFEQVAQKRTGKFEMYTDEEESSSEEARMHTVTLREMVDLRLVYRPLNEMEWRPSETKRQRHLSTLSNVDISFVLSVPLKLNDTEKVFFYFFISWVMCEFKQRRINLLSANLSDLLMFRAEEFSPFFSCPLVPQVHTKILAPLPTSQCQAYTQQYNTIHH